MSQQVVAARYARAFFEYIKPDRRLPVEGEFKLTVQVFLDNRELWGLLASPRIPVHEKNQILQKILKELEPAEEVSVFISLLLKKQRFYLLREILNVFHLLIQKSTNTISCLVKTAFDLTPQDQQQLQEKIKKMTGKNLEMTIEKDPSLIGGLQIYVNEKVYDFSIRNRLASLEKSLIRA